MVVHKNQAWVTSVLDDGDANKAIVLAASLRRVLTTKKIVAIYTSNVSEDARELLRDKFDLALLVDERVPHGVHARDFAKIFAFSFSIFHKCVYLSTSTLVLHNCDDIFDTANSFAACVDTDNTVDTSVYLFTPSMRHYKAMKKIVGNGNVWKTSDHGDFSSYFGKWLQNQEANVGSLNAQYNQKISLIEEKEIYDGLLSDLAIINFVDVHPIDVADKIVSSSITSLGIIESFVADKWLTIYMEEMRARCCLNTAEDGLFDTNNETSNDNESIAIIGMACRYPGGANNPDDFWKMLIEGREGVQKLPHHRWTKDKVIFSPPSRNVSAGFLDLQVDEFDAKFFGVSPKEAIFLDPQQRLLHEVTWEALEDGAVDPMSLRGSHVGVFVGSWLHDYKDIVVRTPDVDFFRIYMGNSIAAGAARLSYFLGTTGPSIATESGCSSAVVAVDMACKSLRNRDTHLAIACGVNLLLHPFDGDVLSFVVAPDGRCKTFDAKANGFGRAEGCGVLLMKRLSDAVKDGDKIWGLIRGSSVTQEGLSKSLGTPTIYCEALAMELALKDAGVKPEDVSFIETHGTGTPVGDPMEVAAITKAYHSSMRSQPLIIGSVKTNVGHTESCSGITGIMKVLLALKNQVIPRHLHFTELNPEINLDLIPAVIPVEEIAWPRIAGKPRIAGVSSFGISGTDGHIIVQEAPREQLVSSVSRVGLISTRPLHLMKISAKTPESLDDLIQRHHDMLAENIDGINFADYAYTANVGRAEFSHRACIVAKDTQDAVKALKQNSFERKEVQFGTGKLCFLFTGQGSQYIGMAGELYNSSPIFRMGFDKCDRLLRKMYDISIKDTLWSTSSSGDDLSRTLYSQTSIFCVEYALLKLWESWGVKPDYVLGHSLGEFAAAVAAGALTLRSAITLVAERSRLIDALPRGKMIVIRADKSNVDKLLTDFKSKSPDMWLDYAALNSSDQTVLAGEASTVERFAELCTANDIKTIILAATHAFHSRHMDPMLKEYSKIASKIKPACGKKGDCLYISGVEGKVLENEALLQPDYWVRHTREKVSFIEACKTAHAENCTFFVEVGPHPVLSALAMANIDTSAIRCFPSLRRKKGDWETILESVSKIFLNDWNGSINWKGFDEYFLRKKISVPFYPFQRKKIWADVVAVPQKIHPLLGGPMENASAITLFQNSLTVKQAPYLSDHVIGSSIVFPGAGFLEMLLAGGYSHVQCLTEEFVMPRRPILLKNMRIESPLGLDDSKATNLQVVVDLLEENVGTESVSVGYKTKVFHWHKSEDGNGHWIAHASGMFMPLVTDDDILNMEPINVSEIQESWEESTGSADLYKRLPEVGLRFGSTFQSLESGWRKGNENGKDNVGLLVSVKVPDGTDKYIAHPVLVDAMIQGAMLWNTSNKGKDRVSRKLQVPVCIGEFIWLRNSDCPKRFVHVSKDSQDVVRVTLLDGNGVPLMIMAGVDFIETTASVVESMITVQSSQIPTLWEELWRHKPGPLEFNIPQIEGQIFPEEVIQRAVKLNKLDPENHAVYHHLDGITVVHFLNALYELGWKPQSGNQFTLQEIMAELDISDAFTNFTRFFLKSLAEEGYLTHSSKDTFVVLNSIPSQSELLHAIRHTVIENEASRPDFKTVHEIGEKLPNILLGKIPVLNLLFPEDNSNNLGLVDAVYETIHEKLSQSADTLINGVLARYKEANALSKVHNPTKKCRILEVGAGTGVHTGLFLNVLKEYGIPYEFHFTDISAAFFNKAQEKFSEYKDNMVFKRFNIEEDPLTQGFSPGYYDIVIAAEVIHATKNIKETLSNLRLVLRDKGHIHILETTNQDRRFTFIFGLLEGYWRFQDYDLREDHACLQANQWEDVLNSSGFEHSIAIPCFESVHSSIFAAATKEYFPSGMYRRIRHASSELKPKWLIFGDDSQLCIKLMDRLYSLGREVLLLSKSKCLEEVTNKEYIENAVGNIKDTKAKQPALEGVVYLWGLVDENERDQANFLKPFLYLCQYLWDNQKAGTRAFVLTQGTISIDEMSAYKNPSPSTLVGVSKTLRTEAAINVKCIDIPTDTSPDQLVEHIFYELWYQEDEEDTLAYRGGKRFSPRLATLKIPNENLSLPKGSDRFQLQLRQTKLIQDLQFNFLNFYNLEEHEIEVKVKAAALNFRDVFCVLKPISQFDKINAIGTDFAGVVCGVGSKVTKWKVGDAVFGCNLNDQQALPSHIKISEETVVPIPDYFTFAEAATLPAVFSTAFYCLVTVANIQKTDTVLIHTASGGVGLSAIQIAQHFKANIIATAGSERKRAYLRSLGIQHVFHSRNTEYGDQILEVTGGKGVDIVLNSLTGPGFKEATLKCCAKEARFVEMSKLSIWKPEEVMELRQDVKYTIADLTTLEEPAWRELFAQMKSYVNSGVVKPIPYVRFDAVNVRNALNYLQKAKHIGKIVCVMPEIKLQDAKFTVKTAMFNDRSTYVITGGITGGIGLETAKYMLSQGAKYLVLVGRSKPQQKTEELLSAWKAAGYHVFAWQADVGDYQQCKTLISKIKDPANNLPPLRGVMHAAGTLSDGTFPNQTWDKFEHTFNAKVNGSWNLHYLTLDCQLEHFVFFSSVAANFGTPAQANHSAGNVFEDALAHYRNSLGLPATTINWGTWGQVGVATEIEIPGFRPLNTQQGIMGLDLLLRTSRLQTGVLNVESFSVFSKFCPRIKNYIDDRSLFAEVKGPTFNLNSDEFWNEIDGVEDRIEKEEVFRKYIKLMIRAILKMDSEEIIDDNAEFQSLGIDSLMMLEMKNNLQNLFGSRMTVSASDLKGCNTTNLLASKLVDILLSCAAAEEVLPTMEELQLLMQEDSKLPDAINGKNPGVLIPSKIKTVLVTGSTGMLAPYILGLVSHLPQITQIVCLLRKRGRMTGEERLLAALEANKQKSNIVLEKIQCYDGDVGQPRLGLAEEVYEQLAGSIDAIIHCSAKVDHLQRYRKCGPQEKFHIRTINVLGTKNILEFASFKQTKLVMHASTFAMIYSIDQDNGRLSEKWEPSAAPEKIPDFNNGYTISKYVAEQLVKQAVERGIPCKSFRFPFIAGDSVTGWHDIRGNHTMLRFLAYMKVKAIPSTPVPIIQLPVDYCAEVAVRLFFDDNSPCDAYNIIPKYPVLEQEFPSIAQHFGYKVELVEYSEFLERLKSLGESSPIHAFMEHYENEELIKNMSTSPAIPSMKHFLTEDFQRYFFSEKMHKYCPDLYEKMESPLVMVKRDLEYLKSVGVFEKFGL